MIEDVCDKVCKFVGQNKNTNKPLNDIMKSKESKKS